MRIDKVITSTQSLGIFDVSQESKVRFVIEDAGVTNTIAVRGRITGQSSFTTLQTIIGSANVVVNVFTYDELEVECTVYSTLTNEIKIVASSFNEAGGSAIESIGVPYGSNLTDIETLTLTSSDNTISIVGDNLTKTIDFTTSGTGLSYTPSTPTDWSPEPSTVGEGLDQLADRTTIIEGILPDKIDSIEKGAADGVAPLNSLTKIDSIYLPSYVDDVVEYPSLALFPITGESDKIYVALDTNKIYRWSGSLYIEISPSEVNSVNGYTGFVVLDKTDIGLDQVDNTSDADKPISDDTQDALDLKVDKAGDTMTGPLNMSALSENIQFSVYGLNSTADIEIRSDDQTTNPSGNVKLTTGDASGSDTAGSVYITGGSNVDGNPANIILQAGISSGTGVNGSITLDSKQVVYLNQNPSGYIDAVNHNIQNVLDPTSPQDAATKKWVENISAITNTLIVDASASIFGADGSLFRPFATIADAVSVATDGTVVILLPGTYSEAQVVIPSTLKSLTFLGTSQSSTAINNGFSYTAPADSIDFLFEKLNVGQITVDASLALNGLITFKQVVTTLDRQDSNASVFSTISESTIFGGTCYGAANLSECLIISNIDIYSPLFIFENCKFVSSVTAYGDAVIRILDGELFGATNFVFGTIVLGNTPTLQIDTASDYLGGYDGDVTKILLALIPLSSITDSGANTDEYVKWDGASWIPSGIDASLVTYTATISGDWSPEPTIVSDALDQLADRVTTTSTTTSEIFTDTKEPTGFINRIDSTISFDDINREFTIAPVSGSFSFYLKGVKYTKTSSQTITISNSDGNHYIYFDASGNLTSTQSFSIDIIEQFAYVSVVYWNTSTSTHTYFAEERHGITMDGVSHAYLHTVFGARYLSGLALQGFSVDGDGTSNTHAQFTADSGSIRDEDILLTSSAQAQIPILYRIGQYWRKKPEDGYPLIYNDGITYTGARIPYNQYTGGAWQLTAVDNNKFVLVHFFACNDNDNPIVGIQGIAQYNDVPAARLAANSEITSLSGLPFTEFVAIGTVIFQTGTFTNTPNAIVRSTNGANYVDFRGTQLYTPAGEATEHSLLSGLADDDHLQYHTDARGDIRYYTKTQIDSTVSGLQSDINTRALDTDVIKKNGSVSFTGDQSLGGYKITNLADPVSLTDAVNLQTLNAFIGSSGDITEKTFSLSSSQVVAANITDFIFANVSVRSFDALVSVYINATTSLYETFEVRGIQRGSDWFISISSEGDNSGITMSITNTGQMQYISTSYSGFISGTMKFRAITTSV